MDSSSRFTSVADAETDPHINGEYLRNNPSWHVEFAAWKAGNIMRLLDTKKLHPKTVCEVGCGAGEVLRLLHSKMDNDCTFFGCDVSPQAIELAKSRERERLSFKVADLGEIETPVFDLMLVLEVIDHVEDYYGFLRMLKSRSELKIFSFSLDICAQMALRKGALLKRHVVRAHRHHFNQELALQTLRETGFEIIDYQYPPNPVDAGKLAKLSRPIRKIFFNLAPDFAVRLLGGYSLLVLAR
jgi:SAM-dependent methyltransferase